LARLLHVLWAKGIEILNDPSEKEMKKWRACRFATQVKDELLAPKNAALIVIDYQPVQVNSIASMDRQKLINNIVGVAKITKVYGLLIADVVWPRCFSDFLSISQTGRIRL